MKYAFMSFSCPELGIDDVLGVARRFGYDGIEPRIENGHAHGIEIDMPAAEREVVKRKAEDAGIAICCIATSRKYADPDKAAQEVDLTLKCIDLAADVGSNRIRVFGGQIPEGISREQASDLLIRSLTAVARHAADRGVIVCMETHDHWRDPEHVAEVIRRVGSDSIAVNWDIMHPVCNGSTMDAAFRALSPWICHVHFHDGIEVDGKLQLVPVGEGGIDHRRAVELLQEAGYDGFLSGEWIKWQPLEEHLPRELASMKAYERG